jgi:hypothetical protein
VTDGDAVNVRDEVCVIVDVTVDVIDAVLLAVKDTVGVTLGVGDALGICTSKRITHHSVGTVMYTRFHHIPTSISTSRLGLQQARGCLPAPASRVQSSRRLRDMLEAAPGLLAHTFVTESV